MVHGAVESYGAANRSNPEASNHADHALRWKAFLQRASSVQAEQDRAERAEADAAAAELEEIESFTDLEKADHNIPPQLEASAPFLQCCHDPLNP